MPNASAYRTLSWLSGAGVFCFYIWITLIPYGFSGTPVAAILMFGLLLATLKLGVREPSTYWITASGPNQVSRVGLLIAAMLGVQLFLGGILFWLGQRGGWLVVSQAIVWVGMPLAGLKVGFVSWPTRCARPPIRDFAIVGCITIFVVAVMFWLASAPPEGQLRAMPPRAFWAIDGFALLIFATMEEVVFRVLLLTALVRGSGSRTQALILSSVLFALIHIPLNLEQPIVLMDWEMLSRAAAGYWPEMVWKIGFGFLLGALWLRTGSLALISIAHAVLNLGDVLASIS